MRSLRLTGEIMKSEQEIIEEIINSVKSRKFRAWIYNLTFSEDDWEDDFDTMIEATEALTDALDDNGREDCEWGIDEVKTYNQIEIELAVKKAIQKGKELGANECILEGKPDKGHPIPVYCPACFDESIEKQASKIAELEKEYLHALECMDRICKRCQDNLERLRR